MPLLYFTALRGDSLCRPRYFRRGRETRLVLVPLQIGDGGRADWILARLKQKKSVTGSRLHQRLFAERRFRHLRVCRSKRLSLELSPRLAVFTEAHEGPVNHT